MTSLEEIRLMAAIGHSEGVVGKQAAQMIVGASDLRNLTAANIMVPRHEVVSLSHGDNRETVLKTIADSGFSRFPFSSSGELDEVVGVVHAKDMLSQFVHATSSAVEWEPLVRDAVVVPETVGLNSLLRTFRQSHKHLALVVDEYGDFQGIVTLEDVVEEVIGDIFDEWAHSQRPSADVNFHAVIARFS